MRNLSLATLRVVLAALVFGFGSAWAQGDRAVEVRALDFLDAGSAPQRVDLYVGKARIIRLQQDVRDVLVADPQITDVVVRTPRLVYILGRQVGETNVFFFNADGNEILRIETVVDRDLDRMRAAFAEHVPNAELRVSTVSNNVVITGRVRSPQDAEDVFRLARRFVEADDQIINMVEIASDQQVLLRVRAAELSRSAVKNLGLQYQFNYSFGTGDILTLGLNTLPIANSVGGARPDLVFAEGGNNALAGVLHTDSNKAFGILLDALENNSLAKTLAEPNLTALSGESANFLAGGEFPVPIVAGTGPEASVGVEFRQFGVALDFTPLVLSDGRISLRVATEISTLGEPVILNNNQVPTINLNRTQTTVELPDGGSIVLAGLLQDNIIESIQGVPGLKDLPVLGALFRSVSFQKNESELIIAITAHLVGPVDGPISLPTDGFAPASDIDMYLFGRLHAEYAKSEALPVPEDLKAPTGYILE